MYTVKLLIEAGSLIQAGYPVEAGFHVPPYDTIKDVIASISMKYKVPVNVFHSERSTVTCAHHIYSLLLWYSKLTMF